MRIAPKITKNIATVGHQQKFSVHILQNSLMKKKEKKENSTGTMGKKNSQNARN
jgi:hypothetical protein